MRHVVMFSGGIGSWLAAKRVAEKYGTKDMTLLFTDTRMEDADLYRFLEEAAANVGAPLVTIAEGRNPWHVYFDKRFLGNSRVAPCSRILKQEVADKWLHEHCDQIYTNVYVGIDWSEEHRYTRLREMKCAEGWHYLAPLCEPPYLSKPDMLAMLRTEGIRVPKLYEENFSHNNCGGFCCRAGQAHFANLLRARPKFYLHNENMEQAFIAYIGRPASILTEKVDGEKKMLTLRDLRLRIERGEQIDAFDVGGCGCFTDEAA